MAPMIDVTVAAVIQKNDKFLVVEEKVHGSRVFNQPAGHLEPRESLCEAAIREVDEETGYTFIPEFFIGVFQWQTTNRMFVRVAFSGSVIPPSGKPQLDDGIIATHWLSRQQLLQRESSLRSPMVLACIDRYLNDVRYPLETIVDLLLPDMTSIAQSA